MHLFKSLTKRGSKLSINVKQLDTEFPYVELVDSKLSQAEISQLEEQHNMKLLSIKAVSEYKTRYGFKKNES